MKSKIQIEYEKETGFVVIFRGTGPKGLKDIRPSDDGVYGPGIYFYNNPVDALAYAERDGGVIVAIADPDHLKINGNVLIAKKKDLFEIVGFIDSNIPVRGVKLHADEIIRETP